MPSNLYPFPHTRLKVFHVALEMATQAKMIADRIPRGHRSLADQLHRAASSVVLNIGEGANRTTSGAKRQRYSEARGEAGEVAANAQLLGLYRGGTGVGARAPSHSRNRIRNR